LYSAQHNLTNKLEILFKCEEKSNTILLIIKLFHNEELHGLYSSPSIIRVIKARRMRWAGHVAHMGEVRGAYNILVGKPERRRPLRRPRRR
jgi:hypothetical protein